MLPKDEDTEDRRKHNHEPCVFVDEGKGLGYVCLSGREPFGLAGKKIQFADLKALVSLLCVAPKHESFGFLLTVSGFPRINSFSFLLLPVSFLCVLVSTAAEFPSGAALDLSRTVRI